MLCNYFSQYAEILRRLMAHCIDIKKKTNKPQYRLGAHKSGKKKLCSKWLQKKPMQQQQKNCNIYETSGKRSTLIQWIFNEVRNNGFIFFSFALLLFVAICSAIQWNEQNPFHICSASVQRIVSLSLYVCVCALVYFNHFCFVLCTNQCFFFFIRLPLSSNQLWTENCAWFVFSI